MLLHLTWHYYELSYIRSKRIQIQKPKECPTGQAAAGDDLRLQKLSGAIAIIGSCTEDILISLDQVLKLEGRPADRVTDWHPARPVSITLLHHVATDGSPTISDRRIPAAGDGGGIDFIKSDRALWFIRFSW